MKVNDTLVKSFALVGCFLFIICAAQLAINARKQQSYRSYYKNQDICFTSTVEGSADYHWFKATSCSTGEVIQTLHGAPGSRMKFLDINGDSIPEVWMTGMNTAFPNDNLYYFTVPGSDLPFSNMFEAL